ncbi:Oidioi.mRNA.OKI2018_I69.PAR.g10496.t1.cds [Oikopleura dioica]|uniref:Oidioi.mRNA.OKI2018_I69.PAR.g10496.t1.cds n=1 Tax=Oikopleura dioica TaxID=34765 RepID=A0ABN7RV50_OIKDI|nr:Oidioi.mRNA.OKI2018_I69.PAR.g10496.t1.cds [Oikopleura dioica]
MDARMRAMQKAKLLAKRKRAKAEKVEKENSKPKNEASSPLGESPKSKRQISMVPEMLSKFKNLHGQDEFENWTQEDVIFDLLGQMSKNEEQVKAEIEGFQDDFIDVANKFQVSSQKLGGLSKELQLEEARMLREHQRFQRVKVLNAEIRREKEKLEQKRGEMIKYLQEQRQRLNLLKDKQAEVDIKRKDIQKKLFEARTRHTNERFISTSKVKNFLREGEVLNDENNRLLEKMNELKADYELASNAFLDDLKQNSSFIRSLRDKLRAIQATESEKPAILKR